MNDTKTVTLSRHLTEGRIVFYSKPITKLFIFTDLVGQFHYHKPEAALQAILEREKAGSTVLVPGVAVPHARLIDVPDVMASLGICLEGVEDPKDSEIVRIFLMFIGPVHNMKKNLDFLAAASSLLSTDGFKESLLSTVYPSEAMAVIRKAEESL